MSSYGVGTAGRVIVTGASSGVGAAAARALYEAGWEIAVVARREERLRALVGELTGSGRRAVAIAADLSDAGEARRAMETAERELGAVDALVICHGTNIPRRRLDVVTIEDWNDVIAVNLSSAFYCVHTVLPGMRERGGGKIVMISSVAGRRPSALSGAPYSASKAGMNALCAVINEEERVHGIRATIIAPGDINTEIMDKRPEPPPQEARARMMQPEDIAQVVLDVLSLPARVLTEEVVVRPSGAERPPQGPS